MKQAGKEKKEKARAVPCQWSHHEHIKLVALLKQMGKRWTEIGQLMGSKNE
jgi:hypothetical protein